MHNDIRLTSEKRKPVIAQSTYLRVMNNAQAHSWGCIPTLSLTSAVGLLLISVADTLSRAVIGREEGLLWAGLLMLIVPTAARLMSDAPTRHEQLGLVILLGLDLYLVKILHSPYGFTFADEFLHLYNVDRIVETGRLFSPNPLLPVTPLYPGLETVTAALASLSGLSAFAAGLFVVGIARLMEMVALFLFYEHVSRSDRLAGIGTLLYTTNPNFLFWNAQFSYKSLALPLGILVLYVAVHRSRTHNSALHRALTVSALLGILGIVVTHHLTSYFVSAFFVAWILAAYAIRFMTARKRSRQQSNERSVSGKRGLILQDENPFTTRKIIHALRRLAIFSIISDLVWLVCVASATVGYLAPVFGKAIASIIQMIGGETTTRQLFVSTTGYAAPLWQRLVGLGSIALMLIGTPFGLPGIWKRLRSHPLAILMALAGLSYFAVLGLRLFPTAWETGNRASDFLFIGLAFILAFAALVFWNSRRARWQSRIVLLSAIAVITVGGVIAGWPPEARLSLPLQVNVGDVILHPQGMLAAQWMRSKLGPGNKVLADNSNGRLLLTIGEQFPIGRHDNANAILGAPEIENWHVDAMRTLQISYVLVDRRSISWNNLTGYYFDVTNNDTNDAEVLFDPGVYGKFDGPQNVSRFYDSGNIVIYDVKAFLNDPKVK